MEENINMAGAGIAQAAGNGPGLRLMNIQDLRGLTFEIPAYQRGFRWRWQQIRELIDDLYEFCSGRKKKAEKPQNEKIYCLQTITIIKTDKKDDNGNPIYEVVDGQQRLTAIWMLVVAFRSTVKYDSEYEENLPVYTLKFDGKNNLTTYCQNVADPANNIFAGASDIDSKFISNGLKEILAYERGGKKAAVILDTILASDSILPDEYGEREKEICIFWNEITNEQAGQDGADGNVSPEGAAQDAAPSEEQEGPEKNAQNGSQNTPNDDWAIERFSHLNAGKIPLTESELIKAYFIDKLASNRVDEFSLQWEEIERGLSDDEFWGFLSSKEYETRIDLLFEIAYPDQNSDNKSHALSLTVAEELKGKDAYTVWQEAVQCYQTLRDWYEDYFFYHMIGYIIAVDKKSSAEIIKELYSEYQRKSKTDFKGYLKERICKLDDVKPIFDKENSIILDAPDNGLSYNGNKKSVKAVLLLFNVALLVNAYEINPDNATERFSFKLYKSKKNPIDIEHINPKHLEGQKDKIGDNEKWAENVLGIIRRDNPQYEQTLSDEVGKAKGSKMSNTLIEQLEKAAELDDLSNLTLLDASVNRSYKDNPFNIKRAHVLAARFGNAIPKVADATNAVVETKAYYKQSVIFPGTMWVFLREYQDDSASQQLPSANGSADFWTSDDRKKYIETMEESISCLLATKGNNVSEMVKVEAEEVAE